MYRNLALAAVTVLAAQMQARGDILRSAHNFAVVAGSAVTSTGPTTINGNVGVWTGNTVTGFAPGTVVRGAMHLGNGVAGQAQLDMTTAYNALAGMPSNQNLTGMDLGGMVLTPGVYSFSSSAALTGLLTLNGLGNPNAKFVFQVGSTLTAAGSSVVSTVNGASGLNVYWQVGSSATLGTNALFKGNIIALASITLNTGASIVDGRALARTGMVALDSSSISSGATQIDPIAARLQAKFGSSVAGLRDVNGDGRADLIVGSPDLDFANGFVNAGRVQIFDGFTGALLRTINALNMQPDGGFGASVAGLDNINGDTAGDFIVGAPFQHPGDTPLHAGRAYVLSGATGRVIRSVLSPNQQADSLFGWSVSAVPDVNGDGRTDYLIGAPGELVGAAAGAGRAYLYSGATGALLRTFSSPVRTPNGNFGWSVAGVPDVTGDGRGDVLIGAPLENPGATPTDAGRAFLYDGATGAFLRVFGSSSPEVGGNFGWSVAGVPDTNDDGRGDILIGAPGESPGASPVQAGRAYLYSGATGALLRTMASPNQQANGSFGECVAGLLDANGDGRGDPVVSAPGELFGGFAGSGRVYIFNGASGIVYRPLHSPAFKAGGRYGSALGSGVDSNTNCDELVIGAPFESPGAAPAASGRAYIDRN